MMRDRDQATRGLMVKSSDGNPRRNPLVKIADDPANGMISAAGHFGFDAGRAPAARRGLAAAARTREVRWTAGMKRSPARAGRG